MLQCREAEALVHKNTETVRQLSHRECQHQAVKFPVAVLADDFDDPMNVGSVFRLCDALGVEKLYLTGASPLPSNRKVVKTSRSTEQYVDYEYCADAVGMVNELKRSGYTIIGLEITSCSVDLRTIDFSRMEKICLIAGAEGTGIKQALLDCCDLTVHIAMRGMNSSMNVATACAIALYEITRKFCDVGAEPTAREKERFDYALINNKVNTGAHNAPPQQEIRQ